VNRQNPHLSIFIGRCITTSVAWSFLLFFCLAVSVVQAASPVVEANLRAAMESEGAAGYLIYFHQKPDLAVASAMAWPSRGEFVVKALQNAAEEGQGRVRQYLDSYQVEYRSFWVANVIVVEWSDKAVLEGLLEFPEVASVTARRTMALPDPVVADTLTGGELQAIEQNISHVKADQVWAMGYTGGGITVANIDSGVRYTHKALIGKYRGNLGGSFDHNYNWWDPTKLCGDTPCDNNDHGTHTMGTIVGDDGAGNQIGMAPGAKWIACKGCGTRDCSDATLLSCGQFILAPTDLMGGNPDPARRPHVVNNSVGRDGGDPWYRAIVNSWQAAGIYPVFSNGNSGPGCGTVGTPGDYPNVTAVGNVDHRTNLPWETSSRGPGIFKKTVNPMGYPYLKPQVSAPGVQIRSSIGTGDDAYKSETGTSMAAPHVAGLVALMLQAVPCLGYAEIEKVIMETATPLVYPTGCGDEGPGGVPNNATGWGMIDALKAVKAVIGRCGKTGILQGLVTSRGRPVSGARVTTATHLATTTDAEGAYAFPYIPEGSHNVSVSAFGYYENSSTVTISAGSTTTEGFILRPKAQVTVRGTVTDGSGAGWPLYASVAVFSPGHETTVNTDPLTGRYTVNLYRNTSYTFTVSSKGYDPEQRTFTTTSGFTPQDFALLTDITCKAPGYEDIRILSEEFEGGFPPSGWSAVPLNGTTNVWRRNDYFKRPNVTGGSGFCADADSEATCFASKWDSALISPDVPIPSGVRATLFYKNRFYQPGPGADAWLEASTDGGSTWQTLAHWLSGDKAAAETVDLSAYAGATPRLRWRYVTGWCQFYWQIDDVKVVSGCRPKEGGLVAGRVLDGNTRTPLREITVSTGATETTSTDAAGVYVLFAPAETQTVVATPSSSSGYGTVRRNVTVMGERVARRDLALPAGRLYASPKGLTATLFREATRQATLLLRNSGARDVSFQFVSVAVPWVSVVPSAGSVPARTAKAIKVIFDAKGLSEGVYTTNLAVTSDTPYSLTIPVTMKVLKR